jgi:hypothetical protein
LSIFKSSQKILKTSRILKNTPNGPKLIFFFAGCNVVAAKTNFERLSSLGGWQVDSSIGGAYAR